MSRIASSNLFDILGADDEPEEVVQQQAAPAPAKGGAKKAAVVAAPSAAPAQRGQQAADAPAEDPVNRQRGGAARAGGRPAREETKNDRHVSRNGNNRDIAKNGGGRANWGADVDENRARGPNSKKIAEEPVAQPEPIVDASAEAAPAAAAGEEAAAADAAPAEPKPEDPADKYIGLDEFLAQKEAKRVAEDRDIKIRQAIVDPQFKTIKVAVSEKQAKIENDFGDLKVAKKEKKEKGGSKRAQNEAIDLYPVGVVNNGAPAPRSFQDRPPQGDRPPRTEGDFRGRGRGGFRGGRGGGAGRGRGGARSGTNLRPEDFPTLVGQPVQ